MIYLIFMNISNSSKNFSYTAIGRIIGAALQATFYIIFAATLDPDQFGQISYFIAIAGTTSIISRFGLPYTVTVFQAKENTVMANQMNLLVLISASIAAIILIPFNIFAAILSLGISFFVMNQHNLLGLKKYKKFMWFTIIKGATILGISYLLYLIFDISGILIGMAIGNFIVCFPFFKSLKIKTFSYPTIKQNFILILHNFGVDASTNLSRLIDKLLIVPIAGFLLAGLYQFNLQILTMMEILPIALHSFLLSEEASGTKHQKISILIILLSVLLVIIAVIISPTLINNLFPKYSDGILGLQIMVISLIPLTISAVLNAKLQAIQSTKVGFSAIIRISSLLLAIGILGQEFGLIGLSIAVLISTTLNSIFLLFLFYKSIR